MFLSALAFLKEVDRPSYCFAQIVELQAQLKEAVNRANQPNENVNHYQHSPHASTSIILADQSQVGTLFCIPFFVAESLSVPPSLCCNG
jgi:hypothetical protein